MGWELGIDWHMGQLVGGLGEGKFYYYRVFMPVGEGVKPVCWVDVLIVKKGGRRDGRC